MSKRAVIISGGSMYDNLAKSVMEEPYAELIGVDRGLCWLYENGVIPTQIVGDFDSIDPEVLTYYRSETEIPIREFKPEKDASDTEIGLRLALELGCDDIILLGATGTRIDHLWGNVQTLVAAKQAGAEAVILDEHNKIRIIGQEMHLKKSESYGPYFSLFSLSGVIHGLTIRGAKYPLTNHTLYPQDSLCISNQIAEKEAVITYDEGVMVLIETRD